MNNKWGEVHGQNKFHRTVEPNAFFKDFINGQTFRGRILMVAEKEGVNAMYAAQKGWQVEVLDVNNDARRSVHETAQANHVIVTNHVHTWHEFSPEMERYHAVAIIHAPLPKDLRKKISHKLWQAMTVGGKLIVEVFSEKQMVKDSIGMKNPDLLYDIDAIKDDFSCFRIELLEVAKVKLPKERGVEAEVIRMLARK